MRWPCASWGWSMSLSSDAPPEPLNQLLIEKDRLIKHQKLAIDLLTNEAPRLG
jgi:hypothetical protein